MTCTKCGLCCIALQDQKSFCDLTSTDLDKLPAKSRRCDVCYFTSLDVFLNTLRGGTQAVGAIKTKYRKVKSGPLKDFTICACVFLQGNPLQSTKCAIYKNRPRTCHTAVKRGDETCKFLRQKYIDTLKESKGYETELHRN